jgi:hypothetical protein
MKLDKIWNGKIVGIAGMLKDGSRIVVERVADRLNTFIGTMNVGECGSNVIIMSGVKIRYPKNVILGDNVEIGRNVIMTSEKAVSKLIIGNNTRIGDDCMIDFSGGIEIGQSCMISTNSKIITHDHGYNPRSRPTSRKMKINSNVWIGSNVTVLPKAANIGKNSIVASCTVVTKDVPDNVIIGGNPMRIIRENL